MKTNKMLLKKQRKFIEKKTEPWLSVRGEAVPPLGWLRAVRDSLGITSRQLAARLGVQQSLVLAFETGEARGKTSLETLDKVAHAMGCKLVYAIVPAEPYESLESILDERALETAKKIVGRADQTMKLEAQGLSSTQLSDQVKNLAEELKEKLDSSLWDAPKKTK